MSDWRKWQLQQWNEHLVAHYFGRRHDGNDLPVVTLLATPDELALATRDASAVPSEVWYEFAARVREAISYRNSLLDHASDYAGWPSPPSEDRVPRFVSHLVFTCLAASESSDELANEGSYLKRLWEFCGGALPDHSIQWLPTLWQNLAAWLEANGRTYRSLRLPNPGGYTRIGHTIRLAFPDRRDQKVLSELLSKAGLLGQEPPAAKVLSLVAAGRGQFRQSFLEAFDDFRRNLDQQSLHARDIVEHRFWAAVRTASARGRGGGEEIWAESSAQFQMLCEEQDERLHPFVVADGTLAEQAPLTSIDLPVPFDIWRYAVVLGDTENTSPEGAYATARAVFQGSPSLPRISGLVSQGLLPFVIGVHGCLELATSDQLEESRTVLTRIDLAPELLKLFGSKAAATRRSIIPEWVEIHGLKLRRLPPRMLENTILGGCWQLQDTVSPNRVRIAGGVWAGDGWLGFREVLPHVRATGAKSVEAQTQLGKGYALEENDGGIWLLPQVDHGGEYDISALMEDGSVERASIRFNQVVGTEPFRTSAEPEAWIVEGAGGTATLSASAPLTSAATDAIAPSEERTVYLGPIVGQFVEGPQEAAWRVTSFAGKMRGARCRLDLADRTGSARVAMYPERRRWRRLLLRSRPDPADGGFKAARSRIHSRAASGSLPVVDVPSIVAVPEIAQSREVAPEVDRLLTILAARGGSRTGIPYSEWARLLAQVLKATGKAARAVTRSWIEAGILDIAFYSRWSHCSIFPRMPQLVVFRTEAGFGATILGLIVPTSRRDISFAARSNGVDLEERTSISALTPSLVAMRCSKIEQFEKLAKSLSMGWAWLDLNLDQYVSQCRHDGLRAPPQNYEERVVWKRWSLGMLEDTGEISFEHFRRRGRPDYWRVSNRGRSAWSYELNTARLWANAMLTQKPLCGWEDKGLTAVHAYLPLPLARFLSVVEGAAPGLDSSSEYRYRVSKPALRESLMAVVENIFDIRRIPPLQAMAG